MHKGKVADPQPMSLLSAYMEAATESPMGSTRQRPWKDVAGRAIPVESATFDTMATYSMEPPATLECTVGNDERGNTQSFQRGVNQRHDRTTQEPWAVAQGSHPEFDRGFGESPLTASSYHTMSRAYDRDTWRMYQRIKASRMGSEGDLIDLVRESSNQIQSEVQENQETSIPYLEAESTAIFELDL
eukprot:Nitzschia sp. Nitz4//scaffold15_size197535//143355//143915//NITZ4_001597-RA/size197535-processed-gene-0.307-mRNA-1//-1//CDS//3329537772//4897//frame0